MPVPTLYPERVLLKLRAGTLADITSALRPGLTRAEFIRLAIDEKIAQLRCDAGAVIGNDQTADGAGRPDTAQQADREDKQELLELPTPSLPAGASY